MRGIQGGACAPLTSGYLHQIRRYLASNHSKKYTYRSEPKQISFRVSESEFAKLKQSAEALQMSVPAFVKIHMALICVLRRLKRLSI
nr:Mobilization protein [Enterococcus faecium]